MPSALPLIPTGLETHPTGTINPNGIINGNWQILNNIFDPTHTGDQAGVLEAALAGMTTITYGSGFNVDLFGSRRINLVALAGAPTIAITNKAAGRSRRLIIVGDGTDRSLTWPAGAVWAGPALTIVKAGTTAAVDIVSTGTTDAGLVLESVASERIVTLDDTQTLTNKSLTSPALTGTPTAPTATPGDNSTKIATTAFVAAIGAGYATLTGTETFTNKTITSGRFNQLNDTGGNAAIILAATASAVNQITATNAATGTGVALTATGSDTNISITISGKGTGPAVLPKAEITASKLALHASAYVEITGSRAITDADNGKILWSASGSDFTLTYPDTLTLPHSSVHQQRGAGALITAASGTFNLRNRDSHTKTDGQWASASVDIMPGTTDVVLTGRTA